MRVWIVTQIQRGKTDSYEDLDSKIYFDVEFLWITILRVVVYRDGMSDGNFDRADEEIKIIKEALRLHSSASCPLACGQGCISCCPPITYIVCQSQNNTRVVPSNDSQGFQGGRNGGVNVHR